jgi:hypothetical protein
MHSFSHGSFSEFTRMLAAKTLVVLLSRTHVSDRKQDSVSWTKERVRLVEEPPQAAFLEPPRILPHTNCSTSRFSSIKRTVCTGRSGVSAQRKARRHTYNALAPSVFA